MDLYIKTDSGDYVEPNDDQLEEIFKKRSDKIITRRLQATTANAIERERSNILADVKEKELPKIRQEVEAEFTAKIEEADKKVEAANKQAEEASRRVAELESQICRKTIMGEYGLRPEAEEFLGTGSEDEMRAKADKLKSGFANSVEFPEKKSADGETETFKNYGVDIKI